MTRTVRTRWVVLGIVVVALLLAGVVSYYASRSPDGLNRVAQDQGFSATEKQHHAADGPFAGYATEQVGDDRLSGGIAGVVGVVVVLALAGGIAFVVRRRRPASEETAADHEPVG
jgi:cobalt/nickel transport protein